MPKEFSEVQLEEIKNKFEEFKNENPEFEFNTDNYVESFGLIIKSSAMEGEHKDATMRRIKEITGDNKVMAAYKGFYTQALTEFLKNKGNYGLNHEQPMKMNMDSFVNFENFMRGMFESYIEPNVVVNCTLKDYRFGSMEVADVTKLSTMFDKYTQEWKYKYDLTHDEHKGGTDVNEDLNLLMETYPVKKNMEAYDKGDIASGAAIMYKILNDKYNSRSLLAKWFFPNAWKEYFKLKNAKNYIEAMRENIDKEKIPFDLYVKNECEKVYVDTTDFRNMTSSIANLIDESKETDKENPDYDLMNAGPEDVDKMLYSVKDIDKIEVDLDEKPQEVNEDMDEINTDLKPEEVEKDN